MKKHIAASFIGLSLLALTACGGGGNAGGNVAPVPAVLTATAAPVSILKGSTSIYTFNVSNNNVGAVGNVGLAVNFGSGVTITQLPQFTCSASNFVYSSSGTASITFGTVPAGSVCQMSIVVQPGASGTFSPGILTIGNVVFQGNIPSVLVN
ncbi:hypothetical protein ACO0K7_02725 [Undibacterium sp. Ji67W]|uniref:hypothetical protein n=1 Tax=Undibacterium sp. Ji67W TaxID=3413042 RepID=UPI003BF28DD1